MFWRATREQVTPEIGPEKALSKLPLDLVTDSGGTIYLLCVKYKIPDSGIPNLNEALNEIGVVADQAVAQIEDVHNPSPTSTDPVTLVDRRSREICSGSRHLESRVTRRVFTSPAILGTLLAHND